MFLTDNTRTIRGFYLPQASNCPSEFHYGESQHPLWRLPFHSYLGSFIGSAEKEQEELAVPEAGWFKSENEKQANYKSRTLRFGEFYCTALPFPQDLLTATY